MGKVGICYGRLGNFTAFWYICGHLVYLWSFGIFVVIWYICGHLVYLWSFGIFVVIWYILRPLGIFYWHICGHFWYTYFTYILRPFGHLVHIFSRFAVHIYV
jgi:hypothetical protein